jgi:hypothetical protein
MVALRRGFRSPGTRIADLRGMSESCRCIGGLTLRLDFFLESDVDRAGLWLEGTGGISGGGGCDETMDVTPS